MYICLGITIALFFYWLFAAPLPQETILLGVTDRGRLAWSSN